MYFGVGVRDGAIFWEPDSKIMRDSVINQSIFIGCLL
jgi:hypothetical protein